FRTARFADPHRIRVVTHHLAHCIHHNVSPEQNAAQGNVNPGRPRRVDLSAEPHAIRADATDSRATAVEAPVTGTFSVAGSTEQFAVTVDLLQGGGEAQAGGAFALTGTFRSGGGAPALITVVGNVTNFNLGAVIGRPRLFPSRMSG